MAHASRHNMRFLVDKLSRLSIGWNVRPLDLPDFHKLCRRFRIKVIEMPLTVGGFYYRVRGKDFIAVDSRLPDRRKLAVLFHELGHYLLHAPESGATASFHHLAGPTRDECEADIFALCSLLPRTLIEARTINEIVDDGFDRDTIEARYEIYGRHGL